MASDADLVRYLPAYGYRRLRWRNGLGWTREVHAAATAGGAVEASVVWDWRLSIAEIESDARYSTFPGVEREQVLLAGEGLALDFGDGDRRLLLPPHGRQCFPGDAQVEAHLQAGRVEVFNLMWRPGRVAARLWHRPLVGPMLLFVEPGDSWAVHVVAGQAGVDGGRALPVLERGDSAVLAAGCDRARYMLQGSGELLLVQVSPAAQ
ncbi:MAG TPA: HutD family protein [Luteimonas sp.]